jgi:hypothetical protein
MVLDRGWVGVPLSLSLSLRSLSLSVSFRKKEGELLQNVDRFISNSFIFYMYLTGHERGGTAAAEAARHLRTNNDDRGAVVAVILTHPLYVAFEWEYLNNVSKMCLGIHLTSTFLYGQTSALKLNHL